MQGIYTYIPETNHVPREYSVAAILLLLYSIIIIIIIIIIVITFMQGIYTYRGEVQRVTGHEGPEKEQRRSSTLSVTLARDGGWSTPRSGRFISGAEPVRIVREAVQAPRPFWTDAENLAFTGIRSPERPAQILGITKQVSGSYIGSKCDVMLHALNTFVINTGTLFCLNDKARHFLSGRLLSYMQ